MNKFIAIAQLKSSRAKIKEGTDRTYNSFYNKGKSKASRLNKENLKETTGFPVDDIGPAIMRNGYWNFYLELIYD